MQQRIRRPLNRTFPAPRRAAIRAITAFGCAVLIFAAAAYAEDAGRPFTDSAGRTIMAPSEVKKAFSVGFPGSILLYTLCREKMVAWNTAPTADQRKFIGAPYCDLPGIGGWGGSNAQINLEQLMKLHPDVIISIGEISEYWKSNADRVYAQTGIPVALIRCDLDRLDETYEMAGRLLSAEARAAELAAYCKETLGAVKKAVAGIPEQDRVRVYYAEGPKGLQTDPAGSFHTQVLDFVRGMNVAQGPVPSGPGRSDVSVESIVTWAPQYIIVETPSPDAAANPIHEIFRDPVWQAVPALKNKAVHVIPQQPFNWFGRPPSVNRLLGVQWLAHTLYPKAYPIDMLEAVKCYYALFYNVTLSSEDAQRLERGEILN